MKHFKLFGAHRKPLGNGRCEKVTSYKHSFGIQNLLMDLVDIPVEAKEITELQYDRIKKLIISKLS